MTSETGDTDPGPASAAPGRPRPRAERAWRAARVARVVAAAAVCLAAAQSGDWLAARPGYRWQFPRDHWSHPDYKTEWWYFTGHLGVSGDTAARYAYQFTVFRVGVLPRAPEPGSDWAAQMLVMGHAAITDLATGRHVFSEVLYRAIPLLGGFGAPGDSLVAWSRGPAGTDDRWTLRWADSGFAFRMADTRLGLAFDLVTRPRKPLAFQGPGGLSRKGAGPTAASLYYSFPRLDTRGTLTHEGRTMAVEGVSWMDKEFGSNQLGANQVGWDWFSLQLDDGRDLMLYLLRDSTGRTDFASGTIIPPEGEPRYLSAADFGAEPGRRWTSPSSRAAYPLGWTITIPGADLRLTIEPLADDQENHSRIIPRLFYWEGAVAVRDAAGRRVGRGFVELVGYGRGMRPAL